MKILVRLAFIVPALVLAGPASANSSATPRITAQTMAPGTSPMHYRGLDRMIQRFAVQSRPVAKVARPRSEPRLVSWNDTVWR